jgi:hypothetical protein
MPQRSIVLIDCKSIPKHLVPHCDQSFPQIPARDFIDLCREPGDAPLAPIMINCLPFQLYRLNTCSIHSLILLLMTFQTPFMPSIKKHQFDGIKNMKTEGRQKQT